MKKLMSCLYTFLLAVAAGACIGIGGTVFLNYTGSLGNFAGAFLFSIGLLTILIFGFKLFTGMVGYLPEKLATGEWSYLLTLLLVWFGNLCGTTLLAAAMAQTRARETLASRANALCEAKLEDKWVSLLVLGVFCGMMMYIAVETFKQMKKRGVFNAYFIPILCVMVFILAGFEHSVADMFYFVMAGKLPESFAALGLITLGNAIGSCLVAGGQALAIALQKNDEAQ